MVTSGTTPGGNPRRIDAQRNYDRLLDAARTVVAQQGTDASLREVARRVGVGIGTFYRHFPSREALLEALLRDGFDQLADAAAALHDHPDPGTALIDWLGQLAGGATLYDGLPAAVLHALHDTDSPLYSACARLRQAAGDLLARAQKAGQIRPDLTTAELLTAGYAMSWAARQTPEGRPETERYLHLLVDGLTTSTDRHDRTRTAGRTAREPVADRVEEPQGVHRGAER